MNLEDHEGMNGDDDYGVFWAESQICAWMYLSAVLNSGRGCNYISAIVRRACKTANSRQLHRILVNFHIKSSYDNKYEHGY